MSDPAPSPPQHPGVFIPPPVFYLLGIVAGVALQRAWPLPRPPLAVAGPLGWACVAGWALVALPAVIAFVRARTAILPIHPSSVLVTGGPYRFTRNPMYVGLALLQAAMGLLWRQSWVLIMLVPVLLMSERFVIVAEERYLLVRFGEEYGAYCARVRRWL